RLFQVRSALRPERLAVLDLAARNAFGRRVSAKRWTAPRKEAQSALVLAVRLLLRGRGVLRRRSLLVLLLLRARLAHQLLALDRIEAERIRVDLAVLGRTVERHLEAAEVHRVVAAAEGRVDDAHAVLAHDLGGRELLPVADLGQVGEVWIAQDVRGD